jgi:hypothetical protein
MKWYICIHVLADLSMIVRNTNKRLLSGGSTQLYPQPRFIPCSSQCLRFAAPVAKALVLPQPWLRVEYSDCIHVIDMKKLCYLHWHMYSKRKKQRTTTVVLDVILMGFQEFINVHRYTTMFSFLLSHLTF